MVALICLFMSVSHQSWRPFSKQLDCQQLLFVFVFCDPDETVLVGLIQGGDSQFDTIESWGKSPALGS